MTNPPTRALCLYPFAAAALIALAAQSARAQTIYVTTAADVTDFGGAQQVADLPGPDGRVSLAEAGLASDHTPGVQTIGFHVPQSEWTYQWLYPGRAVLQPFLGFRVFDTAILDARTQTAFTGDTNPAGGEVVIWASTYLIDNFGGEVRGFDSTQIYLSGGSGNKVQGNTLCGIEVYDSPFALIGGANPGEGNSCGTIKLDRTNDAVVVGNTTARVRVLGWVDGGQPATNNRIGGPTLGERNYITGYGTWSEGCPGGTTLQIFDAVGTRIENNWIGTTPDGLSQGSLASTAGIGLEGNNHDTLIRNNRIAGILGHGTGPHCVGWLVGSAIQIYGTGSGVAITGNIIGLDAFDQPLLGSVTGIETSNYYLGAVTQVVIGGPNAADANHIAGHKLAGISVSNSYVGVRIERNSIHDNGGLGIDLVTPGFATGVTPNDPFDADSGGNGLQNFPVLQAASSAGASLRVLGTLASSASEGFTLEFFASPQCDASGFGEGQQWIGALPVATQALGSASFDFSFPAAVPQGWFVSATATRAADGSTSEFSACVPIGPSSNVWTNLGHALAGGNGLPFLAGSGALTTGSSIAWSLSNAKSNAPVWFVVGFSQLQLPIVGGLLVPSPDFLLPAATSALGTASLAPALAQPLPAGQQVSVQAWLLDPAGAFGWAASNAISASAP